MAQNQYSVILTETTLNEAINAVLVVERVFEVLISLDKPTRRRLTKMGRKSEVFCRQTLRVLDQNPQIVPPSLDLAAANDDLDVLDRPRPVTERLRRLLERCTDTEIALGSDVMEAALEGHGLLKVAGRNQGLEALRKELSQRFAKTRRVAPKEEEERTSR